MTRFTINALSTHIATPAAGHDKFRNQHVNTIVTPAAGHDKFHNQHVVNTLSRLQQAIVRSAAHHIKHKC
eukprot:1161628-Pelagomonas_calceolata.AAC.5